LNKFLAKFSDYDHAHDKVLAAFKKSRKQKPKPKRKVIKKPKTKAVIENHAKGLSYHDFLQSPYWKQVRRTVLERDGRKCIACGKTYGLSVHHMSYKHHGREHLFLEDLATVCKDCHKIMHGIF